MSDRISRRSLLALGGGLATQGLVLGPSGAAPALAAGGFALAPDYRVNWVVQRTSTKTRIVQIPNGIWADTPANIADIDVGSLAMWSRAKTAGNWTITFG